MVKDVNPGAASSYRSFRIVSNGILYFSADDGVHGRELWRTDGTEEGTYLVKDIWEGSGGSNVRESIAGKDGALYFYADDGIHGLELWKSDGTQAGTMLVKDVYPGPNSSAVVGAVSYSLVGYSTSVVAAGGLTYFAADDGVHGGALWATDGTESGTYLVKDLTNDQTSTAPFFRALGDKLCYYQQSGSDSGALWVTDGTEAGTCLIREFSDQFPLLPYSPSIVFRGRLYFQMGDGLWSTDGSTDGTQLIAGGLGQTTPFVGTENGFYFGSAVHQDQVVTSSGLWVYNTGYDYQNSLWFSDGTKGGTFPIRALPNSWSFYDAASPVSNLLAHKNRLYFRFPDDDLGNEPWCSDLSEAGTKVLADIRLGPDSSFPGRYYAIGDKLWFSADDGSDEGSQLWFISSTSSSEVAPPMCSTLSQGKMEQTTGVLRGRVASSGAPALVWFEWGDQPHTLFQRSETVEIPAGTKASEVLLDLEYLEPGSTYYYRVVAQNKDHLQYGGITTLRTLEMVARLQDITTNLGTLSPGFSLGVRTYNLKVGATDTSIRVTPVAAVPGLELTVNGSKTLSGSESKPIKLKRGTTKIRVVATYRPPKGMGKKRSEVYTIIVTRPRNHPLSTSLHLHSPRSSFSSWMRSFRLRALMR